MYAVLVFDSSGISESFTVHIFNRARYLYAFQSLCAHESSWVYNFYTVRDIYVCKADTACESSFAYLSYVIAYLYLSKLLTGYKGIRCDCPCFVGYRYFCGACRRRESYDGLHILAVKYAVNDCERLVVLGNSYFFNSLLCNIIPFHNTDVLAESQFLYLGTVPECTPFYTNNRNIIDGIGNCEFFNAFVTDMINSCISLKNTVGDAVFFYS